MLSSPVPKFKLFQLGENFSDLVTIEYRNWDILLCTLVALEIGTNCSKNLGLVDKSLPQVHLFNHGLTVSNLWILKSYKPITLVPAYIPICE
ncbi:hypothetical protein HAX54_008427 [Datura stramonium]|uniref:Uncharacterized protein n=1 Tax=Datura stramonium TaxID=4076 RepID=A0ABS8RVE6_DATST|nr:hypothetical protein [Datura stramonium]